MQKLIKPDNQAIIYEDEKVYICLASYPITKGHTIVAWKKPVTDLHLLTRKEYEYLMDKVDQARDVLIKALKVEKVYLIYMDEIRHVHWHLIPRYNQKGFNVLKHKPSKLSSFALVEEIKSKLE